MATPEIFKFVALTLLDTNPWVVNVETPAIVAPEETTTSLIVAIPVGRFIWDGNLELSKVPEEILDAFICVIPPPGPENWPAVIIPVAFICP